MSTSTTSGDGDKKPPDSLIKGQEALERLKRAHATEPPKEQASRSDSARPRVTRFYDEGSSGEDSVRLVKTGTGNRQLTKKDRITPWVRLVSRIPKHLADEHNAEVDAELARQQVSSESGDVSKEKSSSGNNQSTKTRPSKKLLGQIIKLRLETFRLWLRKRTSMANGTAAAGAGSGASAGGAGSAQPATQTGSSTTAAPATTTASAPAGTPAAQPGTATGTTGTGGTPTSGTGQNTGGPAQNAPTAQAAPAPGAPAGPSPAAQTVTATPCSKTAMVSVTLGTLGLAWFIALVCAVGLVIFGLAGLYFYVYRDQNIVHETRRAFETKADAEKALGSAHRAEAEAMIKVIEANTEVEKLKRERIIPQPFGVLVGRQMVDHSTNVTQSAAPTAPTPPTPSTIPPVPSSADQPRGSMDNHNPSGCRHRPHEHCACAWMNVQQLPPRITVFPGNLCWSPGLLVGETSFKVEGCVGWWYQRR